MCDTIFCREQHFMFRLSLPILLTKVRETILSIKLIVKLNLPKLRIFCQNFVLKVKFGVALV